LFKLDRSRQRIENLEFFEKVSMERVPGSAPDKVVIVVWVEEKSTGEISFGAGISTIKGPIADVFLRERNLLGHAQDLRFSFAVSGWGRQLEFSFTEPCFGVPLGPASTPALATEPTPAPPPPSATTRPGR